MLSLATVDFSKSLKVFSCVVVFYINQYLMKSMYRKTILTETFTFFSLKNKNLQSVTIV